MTPCRDLNGQVVLPFSARLLAGAERGGGMGGAAGAAEEAAGCRDASQTRAVTEG